MAFRKQYWLPVALAWAMALTGCNLGKSPEPTADVNAIYTAAAETLVSQLNDQLTQTAQAVPPTAAESPTPLPSFTPLSTFPVLAGLTPFTIGTPGVGVTPQSSPLPGPIVNGMAVGCNNASFQGETIKDGTVMSVLHDFDKSWSLQNTGTCTWAVGYAFAFKSGEKLGGKDIKIVQDADVTNPGHSQTFIVHLAAPKTPGEYKGFWQMKDDTGVWFGSLVSVDIIVQ
jgi:hypothetical protein